LLFRILAIWEVPAREEGGNVEVERILMEPLPPEVLRAVPHIAFSVFNLAIPNIVIWGVLILGLVVAAWARLPAIFEAGSQEER
jgi:hypothetical protein